MDLTTLMQEIRTLWRRVAGLEARVANLPVRPAVGGGQTQTIPVPTDADQFLISKEDPDNPGNFIWEAADPRWGA
jgi:hypothetical protein